MTDIDAFIDRMAIVDAIERKGERPPIKGVAYAGYAIHPPNPDGTLLGLAVAHRGADGRFIVDVARENIAIAKAAAVVKRYRARVVGVVGDDGDALADAIAGAIAELRKGALQ